MEVVLTAKRKIEHALEAAVARTAGASSPQNLVAAVRYAVFPGGARVRPSLTLLVADACGAGETQVAVLAATAIELLHCASLVHDDLPCFDDALIRRGKPSVHAAFGEPLAVLVGDALIILAFEELAGVACEAPDLVAPILRSVSAAVGMPAGLVAGQGWEYETVADLTSYHRAKTAALFVAACETGALAARADTAGWHHLGLKLGEAYQVADDLRDVVGNPATSDKPLSQDAANERLNAATELGVKGAKNKLRNLLADGLRAVPDARCRQRINTLVMRQFEKHLPERILQTAA